MENDNINSHDQIVQALEVANAKTPLKDLDKLARRLLITAGSAEAQEISNKMWAGDGYARNRLASTAIASAAVRHTEAPWGMMRVAIGSINGIGLKKDPARALEILEKPMFKGKSAAAYFKSQAHAQLGNEESRLAELEKAAELGHPTAIKQLGLNTAENA